MVNAYFMKCLFTFYATYYVIYLQFLSLMSLATNYQDLTFPSAQCQAICLKKYMKMKLLRSECFKSCKNVPDLCETRCQKENLACFEGCIYLKETLKTHPGQCPIPDSSTADKIRQPSCLSKCKSDTDCVNTMTKCCPIGCSNMCAEPLFNNSVPQLAPQLTPFEIPNSSDIEFEWMSHYANFVSDKTPLTFVLQTRVCPCKLFNPSFVGKWRTLIITSQSGARLNAFDQGKIYQFRLAVVSANGTRGYGPVSKPVPEKAERPDNPAPPRGVTELLSRLYSSGQISVTIGWEKPDEHVLPISEFVVKWMIDYGYVQSDGHAISALTQFTQSVPPDRVSYVLENLKPNTSYRIEVFTKIYWPGDDPLLSEPVVLFIATPAINFDKKNGIYHEDSEGYCKNKTLFQNENSLSAEVSYPFFSNGQIKLSVKIIHGIPSAKYRVSWTPKICIDSPDNHLSDEQQKTQYLHTTSKFSEIKGVMFNCRYHIGIDLDDDKSDSKRRLASTEGYFCVPSCSDVITNSNMQSSHCFDHKTKLPPQPQRLSCDVLNRKNKTYRLSWLHPNLIANLQEDIYKSKYRIIWGPRYKEPVNENLYGDISGLFPIIDSSNTNVKVLSKDTTSLILENLIPQTMYIVKAQLLLTLRDGQEMESDVSTHYFNTGLDITYIENPQSSAKMHNHRKIIWILYISLTCTLIHGDVYSFLL